MKKIAIILSLLVICSCSPLSHGSDVVSNISVSLNTGMAIYHTTNNSFEAPNGMYSVRDTVFFTNRK